METAFNTPVILVSAFTLAVVMECVFMVTLGFTRRHEPAGTETHSYALYVGSSVDPQMLKNSPDALKSTIVDTFKPPWYYQN